jgi:hypothetical protein
MPFLVRAIRLVDSVEVYWFFTALSSAVKDFVASSACASCFSTTVSFFSNSSVVCLSDLMFVASAIAFWIASISFVCFSARFSMFFCISLFAAFTAVVISAMFAVVISSKTYSFVSRPAVVLSRQFVISCSTQSIC